MRLLNLFLPGVFALCVNAQNGGFPAGEILHYSPMVNGFGPTDGAILRINPLSGQVSVVRNLTETQYRAGSMCIDPFRDRVVFYGNPGIGAQFMRLHTLEANGQVVDLGYEDDRMSVLTPGAGGKIYLHDESASGAFAPLRYLDAANARHDLMDAAGVSPFSAPSLGKLTAMGYDPSTNSLLVAIPSNTGVVPCAGGSDTHATLLRLQLSSDGTRVLSQSCAQVAPDPFGANLPVGLCRMPDGDFLLTVDTNSNANQPRMIRVDPATLATSTFASNGFYIGAAVVDAGCYSSLRGEALLLDNFNSRLWSFSQLGSGNVLPTSMPLSFGGTGGFNATMHEVPRAGCTSSVSYYCAAKTGLVCGTPAICASGTSSATAAGGFTVSAGPARSCRSGLLLYNLGAAPGGPYSSFGGSGNGVLCIKPQGLKRAAPIESGGTPGPNCDGVFAIDMNAFHTQNWLSSGCNPGSGQTNPAGFLGVPGNIVHAQIWGRDSTATGQLLSNGISWSIGP